MVANPVSTQKRNETLLLVSFFFALASGQLAPFATAADPPQSVRERIERASLDQWHGLIENSAQAIFGDAWPEDCGPLPPNDLPKANRVEWLSERIQRWTQSRWFVERQTRTWIDQRCDGSNQIVPGWQFNLHDAWIQSQIQRNGSFLHMVQCQIAGDLMTEDSELRLGTAMWFRSIQDPEVLVANPSQARPAVEPPTSPTPDSLPESLRWTWMSQQAWLYRDASNSQRRRLLDLEAAMESVLRSEQRDWQRLQSDDAIIRNYRSRSSFPLPNAADRVFQLSEPTPVDAPDGANADLIVLGRMPIPWRHTHPWSAILEFQVHTPKANDSTGTSILVGQRAVSDLATHRSSMQPHVAIEWEKGKIKLRLFHALPHSFIEIETEPLFQSAGSYTLAVVYEGLPSAETIRLWSDGRWLPYRVLHDTLLRDFAAGDEQVLVVSKPTNGTRLTQLECYQIALSALELEGWGQDRDWLDWESISREDRIAYREYYARRLDLQWRYQRESLLFYADSFGSSLLKVGMVPVADSLPILRLPTSFAHAIGEDGAGPWSPRTRESLAARCGQERAAALARNETRRQWRAMLASVGRPLSEDSLTENLPEDLDRISQEWCSSWDRRELVARLLLSESWTAIAIDLHR